MIAEQFCIGVQRAHRAVAEFPAFTFQAFNAQTAAYMVVNLPPASAYRPLHHPDAVVDEQPTRFAFPLRYGSGLSPLWDCVLADLTGSIARHAIGAALDLTMDELAHPAVALIRDIPGYQIRPHPDSKHKLATVQVFLPSHTRAPHIGTRFYRKDGDAFTETAAVPYLPGQGYFFRRTDNSWHGVEPTTQQDGVRDSLMLIYFDSPKAGFS